MRQRARADNFSHRKKEIDVSLSCVCPLIDKECRHNIVIVAVDPLGYRLVDPQITLTFDNVMTKFMINNRTDTWKADVNLLNSRNASDSFWNANVCLPVANSEPDVVFLSGPSNKLQTCQLVIICNGFINHFDASLSCACQKKRGKKEIKRFVLFWYRWFLYLFG